MIHVEVVGQLGKDRRQRAARRPALHAHADHRGATSGTLVNEMQFHVAPLASKRVLAQPVEVELLQLVLDAVQKKHVEAFGFDLDGVPVVENLSRGPFVGNRDRPAMKGGQQRVLSEIDG